MFRCCPAWIYGTVGIVLVGLTNKPYCTFSSSMSSVLTLVLVLDSFLLLCLIDDFGESGCFLSLSAFLVVRM